MIIREYPHENILWICKENECERTGVTVQELTPKIKTLSVEYRIVDKNHKSLNISEEVYNIILTLMI